MTDSKPKCFIDETDRILVTDDFISENRLEIDISVALRILRGKNIRKDPLGFAGNVAIDFLPFEKGREFFNDKYIEQVESGQIEDKSVDLEEAVQDFLDYMVFAWGKALDERGISASRSVVKLSTWMRILGRQDVADVLVDDDLYDPYGRPALRQACEMLNIPCPDEI